MRAAIVCCAWAMSLGVARDAAADAVEACVSAATAGQKLERAGQLQGARSEFLACDKSACPAEVRAVCDRLLNAVEASLPTVIFAAKDARGGDLVSVQVRVDGAIVATSMDGKAVPLDPGPHAIRFERAGSAPVDQNVVVREAEKNRPIAVTFAASRSASAPPEIVRAGPARPIPALVYVFAGTGAAFLGAFVALDVDGQSRFDACHAHGCLSGAVTSLGTERGLAFGALGAGVVSLGVATWLFLARPGRPNAADERPAARRFDVDVGPGRAAVRFSVSF